MNRNSTEPTVHLFCVGPFGCAVAGNLREIRPNLVFTEVLNDIIPLPQHWPEAEIHALATWRPAPPLCALLNDFAYERGAIFLPLVLNPSVIRLGPIVKPGQGCCWTCWLKRRQQDHSWLKEIDILERHYSCDPKSGPQGYLEPMALFGAAMLSEAISLCASGLEVGGREFHLDLLTTNISSHSVLGIHDCPRCGLRRPVKSRTYEPMQEELSYLWQNTSTMTT